MKKMRIAYSCAAILAAVAAADSFADDPVPITIDWAGGASGSFEVPENWTSSDPAWNGGIPGSNPDTLDTVRGLGTTGGAVIIFNDDASFYRLHREGGSANSNTFKLQGNTLTLSSEGAGLNAALFIYPTGGATNNTLIFDGEVADGPNGGTVNAAVFSMQQANESSSRGGSLILRNEVRLNTTGVSRTRTGFANLTIESGAEWVQSGSSGELRLSDAVFASTTMSIVGSESFYQGEGTVSVGYAGSAELSVIAPGGGFSSRVVNIGRVSEAVGEVIVQGLDTSFYADQVFVGGADAVTAGGDGTLVASSAASVQIGQLVLHYNDSDNFGSLGINAGQVVLGLNRDGAHSGVASVFNPNTEIGIAIYLPNQLQAITALQGLVIDDSILNLEFDLSFSAGVGETIDLIAYDNLTGTFANYGEGDRFSVGGYYFEFSYSLNGANIIGLTVIPEPAMLGCAAGFLAAGAAFILRRRLHVRQVFWR